MTTSMSAAIFASRSRRQIFTECHPQHILCLIAVDIDSESAGEEDGTSHLEWLRDDDEVIQPERLAGADDGIERRPSP